MNEKKEFLTYKDIQKMFNVSQVTVWSWKKKGILPSHKVGHHVIFLYDEIVNAIKEL